MSERLCSACKATVADEFRFCPSCGYDLQKPIVCATCGYANESNSKFCQECGLDLRERGAKGRPQKRKAAVGAAVEEMEPPPNTGITVEFPYSTSQSFDFAVESAKRLPGFKQYGVEKRLSIASRSALQKSNAVLS